MLNSLIMVERCVSQARIVQVTKDMNLYRWLNKRHQDKVLNQISKSIENTENHTKWEDFELRLEERQAREDAQPWFLKAARCIRIYLVGWDGLLSVKLRPRYIVNHVVWAKQRMKRGWCDSDCWSIDSYITHVLSQMLDHLSEHNQAYPGQPPWDTPETWEAHLKDLASRMRAWNNDTFADENAYATTKAAMEEFARNLGHYWD